MIRVRIGAEELRFPDGEWEAHVARGEVPPSALVFSLELTRGLWQRADTLPLYGFFRRSGEEERREEGVAAAGRPPFKELPGVAFPRRGFSGTEMLLGLNLGVALLLMLLWQGAYLTRVWDLAWSLYNLHVRDSLPVGFIATLFIHANLGHLGANMISLVISSAFVEYLYGRRVLLIYLLGGLAGAIASFAWKDRGPMSIGASGAVYALIGAFAGFVLRYHGRLPRWHRWKARRIYIPVLVLATLPSILHADWRAHTGGFVGGVLLGLLVPLHGRARDLLLPRERKTGRPELG
ncbi:MAG: rhomboid family intramembrane serine protease [Candidatus Eisenbacteria sp.]|nr:rhomboid family intramembrane serine protease [Candidatus Eisenbacteria bacterium]